MWEGASTDYLSVFAVLIPPQPSLIPCDCLIPSVAMVAAEQAISTSLSCLILVAFRLVKKFLQVALNQGQQFTEPVGFKQEPKEMSRGW